MEFLSNIAKNYPASGIRKMFDLAEKYDNVIKLTVGEPNFDTPQYIKDAAKKAIDEGFTHYAANAGIKELREELAKKYVGYGNDYNFENVMITVGGMEAITMTLIATVNPGDEVLVPNPCFSNYLGQVMIAGATPVGVPIYEKDDFSITAEAIEKCITPKTRAILLNSPSNPLGSVTTKEETLKIAKLCKKHNLIVISDEVYDKLLYDGEEFFSIAQVPEVKDQVLIINSFSKAYAMTGWRIGYIVGNKDIIAKMPKLQEGMVSCVATFIQKAAYAALTGPQADVNQMLVDYTRRRDIVVDGLNAIPGFSCKKPKGSFYVFANIKAFGKTSEEFAFELVEKAGVVVIPGSAFGTMGEGYIRVVFANSDENLKEALKRIDTYVRKAYPTLK